MKHKPIENPLVSTDRVTPQPKTSAIDGEIRLDIPKALWIVGMGLGSLVAVAFFSSWDAVLVFLILTAITLCAGHSVGMHRLLIHRSFQAPLWVEHVLVYLGVLVGMAGPFGMIKAHDMRDWHQRQSVCPPHPSHGASMLKDAFWQLCCRFELSNPPDFKIEGSVSRDRFYRFLEATWMLQQLPIALLLFSLGGIGWVLWGICFRVFVSLVGHWLVGHIAHSGGHQGWRVNGLAVQGYNLTRVSFVTFGESLHGNHHAFPHSAKLALEVGQTDLGFAFIRALETTGLAWNVQLPLSAPLREGLERVDPLRR